MTRITRLETEFVESVPDKLEPGALYVSSRFATAIHLCCCGCGHEVVTPLNPAKWRLVEDGNRVSLHPSIGNWSLPCRSHYWIERGQVRWAGAFNTKQIAAVQARDRRDAIAARPSIVGPRGKLTAGILAVWSSLTSWWRRKRP